MDAREWVERAGARHAQPCAQHGGLLPPDRAEPRGGARSRGPGLRVLSASAPASARSRSPSRSRTRSGPSSPTRRWLGRSCPSSPSCWSRSGARTRPSSRRRSRCWCSPASARSTLLFVVGAPVIDPAAHRRRAGTQVQGLVDGLSQVLFPIVLLLGLNGLTVGILRAYEHFTIPALSPLVWNIVIMVLLVVRPGVPRRPDAQLVRVRRRHRSSRRRCSSLMSAAGAGADRLPLRSGRFDFGMTRGQAGVPADAAGDARARPDQLQRARSTAFLGSLVSAEAPRRRSTTRSASTCCRRGCSPSPSRRSCSRRCRASPPAATWPACAAAGSGMRQVLLLLRAVRGADAGAVGPDHAARVPARRVRPRRHRAGRRPRCSGSRSRCPPAG